MPALVAVPHDDTETPARYSVRVGYGPDVRDLRPEVHDVGRSATRPPSSAHGGSEQRVAQGR